MQTDRETLNAALTLAKTVTPRHSRSPTLLAIQLRHVNGGVALHATNLDQYLTVFMPVESIEEDFNVVLPHAALAYMVKKAPKGALIQITASGEEARLQLGAMHATLPARSPADWPSELRKDPGAPSFSVREFGAALARVAFASSKSDVRYYLKGVYAHCVTPGQLRLVATDGHRLARAAVAADVTPDMTGGTIPSEAVKILVKQRETTVAISAGYATFTWGNASLQTKLIDGPFPDYARIVPPREKTQSSITVNRAALTIAIEQFNDTVTLTPIEGKLRVSNLAGKSNIDVPCDHVGEAFDVGFNARYMLDCLKADASELVQISMEKPYYPALIGEPDAALPFVLMPMRVKDHEPTRETATV